MELNPRTLRYLYWNKRLSQAQIAESLGFDQSTICRLMQKYKIPARHRGFIPWNKGKSGVFSEEAQHKMSEVNIKQVNLTPTKKLGYFCGLVIGDGSIYHRKSTRNYEIRIGSTKEDLVQVFIKTAQKLGLNPLGPYTGKKTRRFPNGEVRTDSHYSAVVESKILYDVLRPYKQKDYHWDIPKFLTTTESLYGFVGGIVDAEGCATGNRITIGSKHDENLIKFKKLLRRLGFIYGRISVKNGRLTMFGIGNIRLLLEKSELHLKKKKILAIIQNRPRRRLREEYRRVMRLRGERKLGGKQISNITKIPVSTIEDWIYKGKVPWELKITA